MYWKTKYIQTFELLSLSNMFVSMNANILIEKMKSYLNLFMNILELQSITVKLEYANGPM